MDKMLLESAIMQEIFLQGRIEPRIAEETAEFHAVIKECYDGESQYVNRYDYMYLQNSLEKLIKVAQEELEFVQQGSVDNSGYLIQSGVRQAITQYNEERTRIQRKVDNAKAQREYIRIKNAEEVKAREKATALANLVSPLGALKDDVVVLKVSGEIIEGKLHSAGKDRYDNFIIELNEKLKGGGFSQRIREIRRKQVEIVSVVQVNENWKYVSPALKRVEVLV